MNEIACPACHESYPWFPATDGKTAGIPAGRRKCRVCGFVWDEVMDTPTTEAPELWVDPQREALEARLAEAERLLGDSAGAVDKAIAMLERNGIVFDKWPVKDREYGRWTPEEIAALDPEVRWQGVAFSIYTDLAGLSGEARAFLDRQEEPKP